VAQRRAAAASTLTHSPAICV